jgi:ATP-dependent Clp protease adaptor protein ClpS
MMDYEELIETEESVLIEEQKVELKDLIIYNDDVNTFEYVIESLVSICEHTSIQAEQCTFLIHHKGKCSVKRGEFEKLEPMAVAFLDRGISAKIEG